MLLRHFGFFDTKLVEYNYVVEVFCHTAVTYLGLSSSVVACSQNHPYFLAIELKAIYYPQYVLILLCVFTALVKL